jgi:hypothetical protein
MGVFLVFAFCAAFGLGALPSAALVVFGCAAAASRARTHVAVWRTAALALALGTALAATLVRLRPRGDVSPGSDYDVLARDLAVGGLGYGLAPGLGALVAWLAIRRCRPRTTEGPDASEEPGSTGARESRRAS